MERGGHARGLGVSKSWAWHCSASCTRTLGVSKTELELYGSGWGSTWFLWCFIPKSRCSAFSILTIEALFCKAYTD